MACREGEGGVAGGEQGEKRGLEGLLLTPLIIFSYFDDVSWPVTAWLFEVSGEVGEVEGVA